tara:strand:+ start:50 stop:658 length:609 start_codon:yes stop_codon:yes gene_type:complete
MKIICIGKNYEDHIKEMGGKQLPEKPIFFLKPDTAISQIKNVFFVPNFSKKIEHELELIIKIKKVGKNIQTKFSHKYYDQITVGIDLTARDLQKECKKKGLPWEISKSFDNSAIIGDFFKITDFKKNIKFKLYKNKKIIQEGNSKNMIFQIDEIISYVSKYITLKIGDLIFTGTPSGVSEIKKHDILEGYIEKKKAFELTVK